MVPQPGADCHAALHAGACDRRTTFGPLTYASLRTRCPSLRLTGSRSIALGIFASDPRRTRARDQVLGLRSWLFSSAHAGPHQQICLLLTGLVICEGTFEPAWFRFPRAPTHKFVIDPRSFKVRTCSKRVEKNCVWVKRFTHLVVLPAHQRHLKNGADLVILPYLEK